MVAVNQIEIKTVPQLPPLQSPFDDGDLMIVWRAGRLWGGTSGQITENAIDDINEELAKLMYDLSGAVTSADDILPSDSEAGPETDDAFVVASARQPLPPLPDKFAIAVRFHRANTGPTWLRVEGGAESAKVYKNGMDLIADDLEAGGIQTCVWNATAGSWDVFRTSISAVAEHTHPMGDIIGLADEFNTTNSEISAVAYDVSLLQGEIAALNTSKQPLSINLTALAALAGVADRMNYFTGAGAMALATLTAQARTFLGLSTTLTMFDSIKQSATSSYAGTVEFADDAETLALALTTRGITPANLNALVASATQKGITRFSTNAEAIAGTLTTVAVTPAAMAAAAPVTPPAATTAIVGVTRFSTNAEAIAGSLATVATTPASLAASLASYVPAATTAVVGKTRLSTAAEASAGALASVAATPDGVHQHWVDRYLTATSLLDFPSIAANGVSSDLTIAVAGAAVYDGVMISWSGANTAVDMLGYINPAGTVNVRARNNHATNAQDLGAVNVRATVIKLNP